MARKKRWLKARLRDLGKTSAGLGRAIQAKGPRVYEVIAGRRCLQPREIEPAAQYLEWPVEEVIKRLPAKERLLPQKQHLVPASAAIVTKHTIPLLDGEGQPYRHLAFTFDGREDLFCLYLSGPQMSPWRHEGQIVVGDRNRPPQALDHVVLFMTIDKHRTVTVRQLLASDDPDKISLRQHNPIEVTTIERKKVNAMCRVITWDDVVR